MTRYLEFTLAAAGGTGRAVDRVLGAGSDPELVA